MKNYSRGPRQGWRSPAKDWEAGKKLWWNHFPPGPLIFCLWLRWLGACMVWPWKWFHLVSQVTLQTRRFFIWFFWLSFWGIGRHWLWRRFFRTWFQWVRGWSFSFPQNRIRCFGHHKSCVCSFCTINRCTIPSQCKQCYRQCSRYWSCKCTASIDGRIWSFRIWIRCICIRVFVVWGTCRFYGWWFRIFCIRGCLRTSRWLVCGRGNRSKRTWIRIFTIGVWWIWIRCASFCFRQRQWINFMAIRREGLRGR